MQKPSNEWEAIYQIKFSDRTIQSLTLRKAATHCDANELTAVVFLNDEEVGWCDRAGNSGVRIGARSLPCCKLFDEAN